MADHYRRLRNTFRYLLGALDGWKESERLPSREMPELERWVLHRLSELDAKVRETADSYDFHSLFTDAPPPAPFPNTPTGGGYSINPLGTMKPKGGKYEPDQGVIDYLKEKP